MALSQAKKVELFNKVNATKINLEKINEVLDYIKAIAKSSFVRLLFKNKADKVLDVVAEVSSVAEILTEAGGVENARAVLNKCVELGGFDEALAKLNAVEIPHEDVTETVTKKKTKKA